MATNLADKADRGSFLLELQVRDGGTPRIHARRGEVELEVTGASLAEAAGTVFARAMRSSRFDQGG